MAAGTHHVVPGEDTAGRTRSMRTSTQMTAAVLTAFGGPETLQIRHDVPVPTPGSDDVVVEVGAAAVNNTDIWTREGAYGTAHDASALASWKGDALDFPRIQGADIAGRIVGVGSSVDSTRIGERVIVDPGIFELEGSCTDSLSETAGKGFDVVATGSEMACSRQHCAASVLGVAW